MALRWTSKANSDLVRLYEFLATVSPHAARLVVRQIVAGAKRIPAHPRLGPRLPDTGDHEVRRVLIGEYEIRYEVSGTDVNILRLFHTREDR